MWGVALTVHRILNTSAGFFLSLLLMVLALLSCSNAPESKSGVDEETVYFDKDQKDVAILSTYGQGAIRSWQALDDRTLLIESYGKKTYVATFFSRCPWIRSAYRVGFVSRGPYALDRFTKVVFPDGNSCTFNSLKPYVKPEALTTPDDVDIRVESK